MARHSDIRIHMGKMFPTCTIGDITQFLTKLVDVVKHTEEEHFIFRKNQYNIVRLDKSLFRLDKYPHVFMLNDVMKALNDFSELNENVPNMLYTDMFFKQGTYPEVLYLTEISRANINAKLFAAIMRRVYNTHRSGMDSPIYVNHVVRGILIGTVSITNIKFHEKQLLVRMNVTRNGEIVHSAEYPVPIKRSTFQKSPGPSEIAVKAPVSFLLKPEKKSLNPFAKVKQFVTGLFA